MIISASLILLLAFYTLYHTSKRVEFKQTSFHKRIQRNLKVSKSIGMGLVITSFGLFIIDYGIGAGTFIATIMLMTVGSLVIIISPLATTRKK